MRVLLVSHNYVPAHAAGTEIYTAQLAAGLKARGHELAVFTTEKDIARRHLSLIEREHEGVLVFELTNNLHYRSFRETWDYPEVEGPFADVLARFRPEVVHFHHLMYLSVGCAERAQQSGAPVVYTLHDFWLHCARFGQRVHADGSVCHDLDLERCAGCLASFPFAQSGLERRLAGVVAGVRSATGVDLGPVARRAREALVARGGSDSPAPDAGARAAMLGEVRARDEGLRRRLTRCVDRFLSPSRFLRQKYIEWGIDPDRIDHLRTGVDLEVFGGGARVPRGERVRVAFVGTLIPAKGPKVLLEAWTRLPEAVRAQAELEVIGSGQHAPEYQRELAELAARCGARLPGRMGREQVSAKLRATDLLVVPSLWFENAPLVILEALAARTPLLVSDLGGMAELVEEGVSGFHFPMGDADALARKLEELVTEPARLDALYARPIELSTVTEQVAAIEGVYRELCSGRL